LNFLAFVTFSFIFVRNLLKLRRERRARELVRKSKPVCSFTSSGSVFCPSSQWQFSRIVPQPIVGEVVQQTSDDVVAEALKCNVKPSVHSIEVCARRRSCSA
jgi:hypothetical protein